MGPRAPYLGMTFSITTLCAELRDEIDTHEVPEVGAFGHAADGRDARDGADGGPRHFDERTRQHRRVRGRRSFAALVA